MICVANSLLRQVLLILYSLYLQIISALRIGILEICTVAGCCVPAPPEGWLVAVLPVCNMKLMFLFFFVLLLVVKIRMRRFVVKMSLVDSKVITSFFFFLWGLHWGFLFLPLSLYRKSFWIEMYSSWWWWKWYLTRNSWWWISLIRFFFLRHVSFEGGSFVL